MKKNKRLMADRRVSLQSYEKSSSKKKQKQMKQFEKSKMLLQILKQVQGSVYKHKENNLEQMVGYLGSQNQLMQRILELQKSKNYEPSNGLISLPSVYVLEQLDVNRKETYIQLEKENSSINQRINKLEDNLQRLQITPCSSNVQEGYLRKLAEKIKTLKKYQSMLSNRVKNQKRQRATRINEFEDFIEEISQKHILNEENEQLIQLMIKQFKN